MDRNYFLSYGHKITLLLLLAAVGKLNAKFISVMTKPALSCATDINNHLQRCSADVSIYLFSDADNQNLYAVSKTSAVQNKVHSLYFKNCGCPLNFFNNSHLQKLLQRESKLVTIQNRRNNLSLTSPSDTFPLLEEVKKLYTNSVKLIDGFKFIVKIPDKLMHSLI
ncbi:hypothetical protein [uncultured Chryseobacterium sp.]|uniref:hypothetical protein n=1 Tax=uncultured Chryseobacterium sp. TaxID=259322 RepID=UPI002586062E|nr:hypothetical protein [uncultured Chryseobacterium sp.]